MGLYRTVADPATLASLVARLEALTSDQPRRWGSITAHQMVAHLAWANEAALGRVAFSSSPRPPSSALRLVALYAPARWPRNIKSGAEPAADALSDGAFEADRSRAIRILGELALAPAGALVARHPIFGPMTPSAWRRWAWLHADHHLRQFGL